MRLGRGRSNSRSCRIAIGAGDSGSGDGADLRGSRGNHRRKRERSLLGWVRDRIFGLGFEERRWSGSSLRELPRQNQRGERRRRGRWLV